MDMNQDLRAKLAVALGHYVDGVSTLEALQEWLLSHLQAILDSGDALLVEAANDVDAALVQLGEELIDEAALLDRIKSWEARLRTLSVELAETRRQKACVVEAGSELSTTIERRIVDSPVPMNRELRVPAVAAFG